MNIFKNENDIDKDQYIIADYFVQSKTSLKDAAWNLAIGQSVGNPNVRNKWETDELFEKHSCIILHSEEELQYLPGKYKNTFKSINTYGAVKIGFPVCNTDWGSDGISHLLCQLMGGHVDIDIIERCNLKTLSIPDKVRQHFYRPKYGITGMRDYVGSHNKPLFGAIIKPKIGINKHVLLDMVKELVDGGVDFIKEDEIMSNPACCPLSERVPLIANYLSNQSRKVVFCHTINADPHVIAQRVNNVYHDGGNGIHINVWSGLGVYNSIRKLDYPLFLHFQKSGDRVFTNPKHAYSIDWSVICQLATMMGVDTIQAGMVGGYSNDNQYELNKALDILRKGNTVPALSCGMHPGLVEYATSIVGNDYMANVGGAVHGHPDGTLAGAKAMRQAVDGIHGPEYTKAIETWGLK